MKAFIGVLLLAVAASASWLGHHHVPSGSVSVGHNGVVVAGPAGSVHTDNGLHGHGAGARLSGPAGDVATHGGHAHLAGPGAWHHGVVGHGLGGLWGHHGGVVAHGLVGHHGGVVAHGLVGHGLHGW